MPQKARNEKRIAAVLHFCSFPLCEGLAQLRPERECPRQDGSGCKKCTISNSSENKADDVEDVSPALAIQDIPEELRLRQGGVSAEAEPKDGLQQN